MPEISQCPEKFTKKVDLSITNTELYILVLLYIYLFSLRKNKINTELPTFLESSRKKSLARSAMRCSLSSKHVAISLIWPLTFTMSFRIRCVSTISVFLRTCADSSRSLKTKIHKESTVVARSQLRPLYHHHYHHHHHPYHPHHYHHHLYHHYHYHYHHHHHHHHHQHHHFVLSSSSKHKSYPVPGV